MSLVPYCEGCKWNNGYCNEACVMCFRGNKHEPKNNLSDYRHIDEMHKYSKSDAIDSMIYATTARGNGKSSYLYEKMKQAVEDGAKICMVRKNGRTLAEMEKRELKEILNMAFGNLYKLPEIKDVIFNDPATIVFWSDDTKTVVKAHNEEFDPEKGLAMAICKKILGNKGNFNNVFKKWIPEKESEAVNYANLGELIADGIQNGIRSAKQAIDNIYNSPFSKIRTGQADNKPGVNYFTVKGLAAKERVSEKVIRKRIADGVYPGAFKQSGAWLIPIKRTDEK